MHGSQEALGMLSPMDGAADKLLKGDLSGAVKEAAIEAGGGRVFKAAGKGIAAVKRHAGKLDEAVGALSHADDAATATATGVRESIEEATSVLAKEGGGVVKGGGSLVDDVARTWCFVAGTEVKTPEGAQAIEKLVVGDKVITHDPETGEEKEQVVLQTFHSWTDELYDIAIRDEVLSTTGSHRFWLPEEGSWVPAKSLKAGQWLLGPNNVRIRIDAIATRQHLCDVYNLEVESDHNYFVGLSGVLVHNGDPRAGQDFGDYNRARNAALEWLQERGFRAEAKSLAGVGPNEGRPIGMMTADGKTGFRVEFDERNGAHINVWSGKDKGLGRGNGSYHYRFDATEKTVGKIQNHFLCK